MVRTGGGISLLEWQWVGLGVEGFRPGQATISLLICQKRKCKEMRLKPHTHTLGHPLVRKANKRMNCLPDNWNVRRDQTRRDGSSWDDNENGSPWVGLSTKLLHLLVSLLKTLSKVEVRGSIRSVKVSELLSK